MKNISLLVACALALAGCAGTPARYVPVAGPGTQDIRSNKETGKPYVLSAMDRSKVAIEHADFAHKGLTFNMKVVTDEYGIYFGPASIAALQGESKLAVLGRKELTKSVSDSAGTRKGTAAASGAIAFLGALAGTLSGQTAAASNFMTHMQSSATDYQQAASDEQGMNDAVAKTHLDEALLAPGQLLSGMITIEDASSDQPLELRVAVGREIHTIRFRNAAAD